MISSAPVSSIRSTIGEKTPAMRAPASSAATAPSFSRRKRASSRAWALEACTSAELPSASSATTVSEPLRRRRSRAARRESRAKLRAAHTNSGTTTSEASASFHDSSTSAPAKNTSRADALDELAERRQQQRLDRVDVAGEAREHVAVAAAVERVGLEPLEVGEHARAQREREALADPGGEVLVAERQRRAEQREPEHRERVARQRPELAGREHVVDDQLEDPDLGRLDGRQQRREHEAEREHAAQRPRQRPEAAERRAQGHGRGRGDEPVGVRGRRERAGEAIEEGAHETHDGPGPERPGPARPVLGVGVAPAPAGAAAAPAAALATAGVGVGVAARQASGGDDGLERTMSHDCLLLGGLTWYEEQNSRAR